MTDDLTERAEDRGNCCPRFKAFHDAKVLDPAHDPACHWVREARLDQVLSALRDFKSALEADWNAPHVVHLADDGWRLQHPLRCHDDLHACKWNTYLDEWGYDMLAEKGPGFFEIVERADPRDAPDLKPCSPHRLALKLAALAPPENPSIAERESNPNGYACTGRAHRFGTHILCTWSGHRICERCAGTGDSASSPGELTACSNCSGTGRAPSTAERKAR